MRLTLRTLLAYLDDILPPSETKEIGEKIAASPVASQLVDRVREVMRRRRLTAPETDGSGGGIEANLISEYLDNSLPADRVADVERICLESDVNLAEVAACHQILTLVLGEPVDISSRLRERMYALGPQGTPLEVPEPPAPSKRIGDTNAREQLAAIRAAQQPKSVVTPAKKSLESRLPDYLKRKPLWKRLLPWAAVALVAAVWLGLLYGDPSLFGRRDKGDAEQDRVIAAEAKKKPGADPKAVSATEIAPERETDTTEVATEVSNLPVDPEPPTDDVPLVVDDTPVMDRPEPAAGNVAASAQSGADNAVASTAGTPTGVESKGPEPAGTPARPTENAPPVQTGPPTVDIVLTSGPVLAFDTRTDQWMVLPKDKDPRAGDAIAVPYPFEAEFSIGKLPLHVTALAGTRFQPFGATEAAPVGFDLTQGRFLLKSDSNTITDPSDMMFALRLGQGLWRIEPLTVDTTFGIEAQPLQPTGEGQDLSQRTPQGVVYVREGAVRIADASGRVEVASAGNRLVLNPLASTGNGIPEVAVENSETAELESVEPASDENAENIDDLLSEPLTAATAQPEPTDATAAEGSEAVEGTVAETPTATNALFGLPDWLTPREPTSSFRQAATAFEEEFVYGAPAVQSFLPAVNSSLYYVAESAVKGLALTGDVHSLVKALQTTDHEEARLAAIDGLRNWLGRNPSQVEELQAKLQLTFAREGMADAIEELLWGYDAEDAQDETTSRRLVAWLDHPEPIIRQMAFYHIKRLAGGRTMYYRPNTSARDRASSIRRWSDFIDRNGGLVIQ